MFNSQSKFSFSPFIRVRSAFSTWNVQGNLGLLRELLGEMFQQLNDSSAILIIRVEAMVYQS